MGKIAFVFSGQGDQRPGMGKEMMERYPAAAEVFSMCDRFRPGTSEQCFGGTEEELKETKNAQPCLFAVELAAAEALMDGGTRPDVLAGFSLGEVTASVVSGIFDAETGFRLVCRRGELMQREAEKHDTSMAAIVKLTAQQVQEICEKYEDVYPVNYNYPGQTVISGLSSQMGEVFAEVKAAGGRALPLKVRGAFHSPFMKDAAADFCKELAAAERNPMQIPLYSNVTASLYTEDVTDLLSRQITSPVQWERIVRNMIADGVDTFVEVGPGKTLTNMIRKIDPQVKACAVSEYLEEVASC